MMTILTILTMMTDVNLIWTDWENLTGKKDFLLLVQGDVPERQDRVYLRTQGGGDFGQNHKNVNHLYKAFVGHGSYGSCDIV